jgi:hypothetical protein
MKDHFEQLAWITGQTTALVTLYDREGNKALDEQIQTYTNDQLELLVAAYVITLSKLNELTEGMIVPRSKR